MKTNLFMALAATAAMLAGCNSDENADNLDAEVPAVLITNLGSRVQTRASDTNWDAADNIGIFSLNDEFPDTDPDNRTNTAVNLKYTNGKTQADPTDVWSSENPFRFKNPVSADVTFKAYYPWVDDSAITDGASGKINGNIAVDASTQTADGQKACDFLFADKANQAGDQDCKGSKSNPQVSFYFKHSMSKVILVFKPDTQKGVAFDDAFKAMVPTLKGLKANGTFSLADGAVILAGGAQATDLELGNKTVGDGTTDANKSVTFVAIVPPQTPASDGTAPEISIRIGSDTYLSTKILAGQQMEAGKYYKYTITVKKMELIVSGSDIKDWEVGVDNGSGDAVLQ